MAAQSNENTFLKDTLTLESKRVKITTELTSDRGMSCCGPLGCDRVHELRHLVTPLTCRR